MTKKRNFKVLIIALVLVALVATCFSLVACKKDNTKSASANYLNPKEVFALAGVSTGSILKDMGGNTAFASEVTDAQVIEELNNYMALVDTLITSNPGSSESKASDREDYATMQVMNVPALDGSFTAYTLYYNEDAVVEEDEDEDEEEDEYESHITGIMVIEGVEYPIKGDIEIEQGEQEIEFIAYLDANDNSNYIEFSQEMETNESEFEYAIYRGGNMISSFSLEIETEDYKNEFGIEIEDAENGVIEYEITKDTEDNKISVEYTKNGEKGNFSVVATEDANGNPIYKYYLEGKEIDKDRD